MKLIHNSFEAGFGHKHVLAKEIESAREIRILVAYVNSGGVAVLRSSLALARQKNNAEIRLICSLDMGTTDPRALKELVKLGIHVKAFEISRGTFHPKVWLCVKGTSVVCLIGSANWTSAALTDNIEASVFIEQQEDKKFMDQVNGYFEYLWDAESSSLLSETIIDRLIQHRKNNKTIQARSHAREAAQARTFRQDVLNVITSFVENWINLWQEEISDKQNTGRHESLGRGWYVIPDQGYIDEDMMNLLRDICQKIGGGLDMSRQSDDPMLGDILKLIEPKFVGKKKKMDPRSKFVRQEKNYLIRLGFCYHPIKQNGSKDKNMLLLTHYGERLSKAKNILEIKHIYTESMMNYEYHGLSLLRFTRAVLEKLQNISFDEFSFFVKHAFAMDEKDSVIEMVDIYRSLNSHDKEKFIQWVKEELSKKIEPSAKNVVGNYNKSTKHTMSALGWCKGLIYDDTLRVDNSQVS